MVPQTKSSGNTLSSRRAAMISSVVRRRVNSSSGTPRYTTLTRSEGIRRALMTKSVVLFETAMAMSVDGASSRSAIF